ncbi:hypothetical protein AB205_0205480 [Aquarana catesbeiana]|uniref:Uncharacterized protein n=1 Tax=Aquarana catesbeiana TaxID=8400 RepID=A0A2G9RS77_AQUCT|nr:hypothetical protein AB205_0205480 [Aquarana catesbeiana]
MCVFFSELTLIMIYLLFRFARFISLFNKAGDRSADPPPEQADDRSISAHCAEWRRQSPLWGNGMERDRLAIFIRSVRQMENRTTILLDLADRIR